MYGYISGEIKEIEPSYVIIDNNGIGYLIYVPNPYGFMIGKNYTIYTYTKVAEDEYSLYGFKTKEEKELTDSWNQEKQINNQIKSKKKEMNIS